MKTSTSPNRQRLIILGGIFIGLIILALWAENLQSPKETDLRYILKHNHINFLSDKRFFIETQTPQSRTINLKAKNQNDVISVKIFENISKQQANQYFKEEDAQMQNLFTDSDSPYPGQVSSQMSCPDQYHPVKTKISDEQTQKTSYALFANKRLTFGGCNEDLISYAATVTLLFCPADQRLIRLEHFTPKNKPSPDRIIIPKSLKCL